MDYEHLSGNIIEIAQAAGHAIMDVYASADFGVEQKADNSPFTRADIASHRLIVSRLQALTPDITVISEESDDIVRNRPDKFWLVDPLDGTREFIKRNGEFTVNIALIDSGIPVLGVVQAPVPNTAYVGYGTVAYKLQGGIKTVLPSETSNSETIKIVSGRSRRIKFTRAFARQFDKIELIRRGSSLKLCMVAEGKAHLYPRFGPSMEWDTAAGDAVIRAAGGMVNQLNGQPLKYNKDDLLNPFFIATSKNAPEWRSKIPLELLI